MEKVKMGAKAKRIMEDTKPRTIRTSDAVRILGGTIGANDRGCLRFLDVIVEFEGRKCLIPNFTINRMLAYELDPAPDIDIRGATHLKFLNGPIRITPFMALKTEKHSASEDAQRDIDKVYQYKYDRLSLGRGTIVRLIHKPPLHREKTAKLT